MASLNVVTPSNLGTEFDVAAPDITLKLGTNLEKAADGTINVVGTIEVDQTFDATFSLTDTDIHPADGANVNTGSPIGMADKVLDAGWSRAANVVTFTGAPEKVKGYITINAPDAGASNYWSRPKMRVSRGGTVIAILDDLVMQQTGAYDGDATINGVFFDKTPPANPAYTFEWFDQEARTSTLPPIAESQIALEATLKVEVFAP